MRTRRTFVFRLLALSIPFCFLAGLEGALRLFGFGGYPPLFRKIAELESSTLYETSRERAASYFGPLGRRISPMEPNVMHSPKSADTVRIIVLGESAARGYPQPRAFSAAEFLRRLLQAAWPDRKVEVLNFACTAIASYPVLDIAREALRAEPDVAILYIGNNEFYGAYGVASRPTWAAGPAFLRLHHVIGSLALVQAPARIRSRSPRTDGAQTLIEMMAGKSDITAGHPARDRARRTIEAHAQSLLELYRARGVPVIVCTSPSNERDLAPIGEDPAYPGEARMHWNRARALFEQGRTDDARAHVLAARDADPMPWRATSAINDALRRVARAHHAPLCDLVEEFQRASPDGLIGWELMDDHVHPTLTGQLRIARAWVAAFECLPPPLHIDADTRARLPDNTRLLEDAGDNIFERFGVAHGMRLLFDVPFFKRSNPDAAERFRVIGQSLIAQMPPFAQAAVREWQAIPTLSVGRRPLSGMVAMAYLQQNRLRDAIPLLRAARASSPAYTAWDIEYTFFELHAQREINGDLTEAARADARAAIERARILRDYGHTASGQTERFAGRLHQLLGEHEAAIPWLESAAHKLNGIDRVACDQALIAAYLQSGRTSDARAVAAARIPGSGTHRDIYEKWLREIDAAP